MSAEFTKLYETAAQLVAGRLDSVVEQMLERLWANPALERWTRPETREPARAIAEAALAAEVGALVRRELPAECPPADLAAARAAVAYDAPVTVVLQCYRAGHAALSSAWLDAVDELGPAPRLRRRLIDAGAGFMFDYVDRCSAWVEREHARERERALRGAEQRRMRAVLQTLAGDPPDEDVLGYDLEAQHHLAVVAWGERPDDAVRALAAALDAESLAVSVDPQTAWAWLGSSRPPVLPAFAPPPGTWLAVGGPAAGPDGFRDAHADALDAQRVARLRPAPVTSYADVGLEALGATDERRARAFVAHELGSLAGAGTRPETLRATLGAYFASGQNAASAAARLGVHERTIANRLHTVENMLGRAVATRRAELEMALRLRDVLASPPAPPR
jgi:hypothetical protein